VRPAPARPVSRDEAQLPRPAEYGDTAERTASSRGVTIMSAHTAEKIIGVIRVQTTDEHASFAVAQAAVSEVLTRIPDHAADKEVELE
jgi:hypothetical protein